MAAADVLPAETSAATAVTDVVNAVGKTAATEKPGLLASSTKSGSDSATVVAAYGSDGAGGASYGGNSGGDVLDNLMTPEGLQEAGTTVAVVAAAGALMGLVGLGVSVAGVTIIGAATIGTAGAVGLTGAADLAADLAAAGAAGAAAKKRRRKDEDGDESQE